MIPALTPHTDHIEWSRFELWDEFNYAAKLSIVCQGDDKPRVVISKVWRFVRSPEGKPVFWINGSNYTRDLRRATPLMATTCSDTGFFTVGFPNANGYSVGSPVVLLEVHAAVTRLYVKSLWVHGTPADELDNIDLMQSGSLGLMRQYVQANNEAAILQESAKTAGTVPDIVQNQEDAYAAAAHGVDLAKAVPAGGGKAH